MLCSVTGFTVVFVWSTGQVMVTISFILVAKTVVRDVYFTGGGLEKFFYAELYRCKTFS